ncbi:unnamed protein product, partial [Cyprideis torosa]
MAAPLPRPPFERRHVRGFSEGGSKATSPQQSVYAVSGLYASQDDACLSRFRHRRTSSTSHHRDRSMAHHGFEYHQIPSAGALPGPSRLKERISRLPSTAGSESSRGAGTTGELSSPSGFGSLEGIARPLHQRRESLRDWKKGHERHGSNISKKSLVVISSHVVVHGDPPTPEPTEDLRECGFGSCRPLFMQQYANIK